MLARALASVILVFVSLSGYSSEPKNSTSVREVLPLISGWKFWYGKSPKQQVTESNYDDAAWTSVEVPHSWNRVGYYSDSGSEHIHTAKNVDLRQGVGWYRLKFALPTKFTASQRAWLEFDAVSRVAEVWVNGIRIGEHRGGFTRFRFDVTDALSSEGDNVLVVKADNSKPSVDSSTADTLPIAGDFFVHGGIYRPARLIVTDQIHLDMLDFGGPGVYASTTAIRESSAEIAVRSRIRNDSSKPQQINVHTILLDAEGQRVADTQECVNLNVDGSAVITQKLIVAAPILWQGVTDPYLYTLTVELRDLDGILLDSLDQHYGLRHIEIDPEQGLLLNGVVTRLYGVGYHQDREGKGWAVSESDIAEDMSIMREMGVNTVRLAHYPHGQTIHELANQHGIILWDEIPLVSSWAYEQKHAVANKNLGENAKLQLRELIRQNFNHPSVAVWGVANEVDFGALLPAFLAGRQGDKLLLEPLLQELAKIVKEEDPGRYSALANCCEARKGLGNDAFPITTHVAELAGANRYFGWYYGKPQDLDSHLDHLRTIRPDQPISVTEYGAGGDASLHSDNPLGGAVDARGRIQPEEYMSWVHEENWRVLEAKPYLWAIWIWNGFDFATTTRREGDSVDINTKGLVTYDRTIKKDSFYFYKANWSEQPTVHITGRRYQERAYPTTDVRVYSNTQTTELTVNGESLGTLSECTLNICEWKRVSLKVGVNDIRAVGRIGAKAESDEVQWHLASGSKNAYHIDVGALIAAESTLAVYGSDNFFSGGEAKSADKPGGWGREPELAVVKGSDDRKLMTTYREGNFSYHLPTENGVYSVRLRFMEPSASAGKRVFHVLANNEPLLTDFDIASEAGGKLTVVERDFKVVVTDGTLKLSFKADNANAIVSAINVMPALR